MTFTSLQIYRNKSHLSCYVTEDGVSERMGVEFVEDGAQKCICNSIVSLLPVEYQVEVALSSG